MKLLLVAGTDKHITEYDNGISLPGKMTEQDLDHIVYHDIPTNLIQEISEQWDAKLLPWFTYIEDQQVPMAERLLIGAQMEIF